jgi:hypothetical protein
MSKTRPPKSRKVKAHQGQTTLTIVLPTSTYEVPLTHFLYKDIIAGIEADNPKTLFHLLDPGTLVKRLSRGKITYTNKSFQFKGKPFPSALTTQLMSFLKKGINPAPLLNCITKALTHPLGSSIQDIFTFMQHKHLMWTPEGLIIAYKGVAQDYYDIHSRTFLNIPGALIRMDRSQVCINRKVPCGTGLHVGSWDYASNWGRGGHVLLVAIEPFDCMSVPKDSSCQKMRTCGYRVLEEITQPVKGLIYDPSKAPTRPTYPKGYKGTRAKVDTIQNITSKAAYEPANVDDPIPAAYQETTEEKVRTYIDNRLKAKNPPTMKAIQSRLKGTPIGSADLQQMVLRMGYRIKKAPTKAASAAKVMGAARLKPVETKVLSYLNARLGEGKSPTIKAIQSRLKEDSPSTSALLAMAIKLGFSIEGDVTKPSRAKVIIA